MLRLSDSPGPRLVLGLFLLAQCLAWTGASASEVSSPVELVDDGKGFRLEVALRVPPSTIVLDAIYNRIANGLVDAGAPSVDGLAVVRELDLESNAAGQLFVSLDPHRPESELRDGVYSQWIEIHYVPQEGARSAAPFRQRQPFYFEVVNGTPRRLTLLEYSDRVEPTAFRRSKRGDLERVHPGTLAGTSEPPSESRPSKAAILIESGDAYISDPNESERGQ